MFRSEVRSVHHRTNFNKWSRLTRQHMEYRNIGKYPQIDYVLYSRLSESSGTMLLAYEFVTQSSFNAIVAVE